jgi:hypothetical protein
MLQAYSSIKFPDSNLGRENSWEVEVDAIDMENEHRKDVK